MVTTCRACGFKLEKNSGRSSDRFPKPTDRVFKDWDMFVGKPVDWIPPKGTRLCGDHFAASSFNHTSDLPTLNPNAIPTIQEQRQSSHVPLKLLNGKIRILEVLENSENSEKQVVLSDSQHTRQQAQIQELLKENEILKHKVTVATSLQNEKELQYNAKTNSLQLEILNLRSKLQSAQHVIVSYKQKNTELVDIKKITDNAGPVMTSIITTALASKKSQYDEDVRRFATTIMSYSKKAYEFLRSTFNKQLPCPRTIKRLLSKLDVKPGFLRCTLEKIRDMSNDSSCKLFCTFMVDEIAIRNQAIVTSSGEISGFVDYGDLKYPLGEKLLAKSALFVMAVAINGNWKLPIGYFLTDGLSGDLLVEIIRNSLVEMHDTGARTIAITFDGLPANLAAAEKLGAQLSDPANLVTWFPHPVNSELKVYVVIDPPHMLKLIRNLWTSPTIKGFLLDHDNNILLWGTIVKLYKLQQRAGVRAGNGLTSNQVNFKNNKMKVLLAAKVFSQSLAKSLELCKMLGLIAFLDSSPLSKFLDTVDRGFDLLNIRHPKGTGRKAALTAINRPEWTKTMNDMKHCMLGLKTKAGKPIIETPLKTGPLGFIIAMESVKCIMDELVCCPSPQLKYLLTYKFSQDHLEIYFSSLRACGGFNDNPNVKQLEGAIKSVLSSSISPSLNGNCLPLDDTHVPVIRPIRQCFVQLSDLEQQLSPEVEEEEECPVETYEYSTLCGFLQNVASYIVGSIVKKVLTKIHCTECKHNLIDQCGACVYDDMKLIDIKQNGGLHLPSRPVVMICRNTETTLRYITETNSIPSVNLKLIEHRAFQNCFPLDLFHKLHQDQTYALDYFNNNHKVILTKMIIREYSKIRLHHHVKEWTRTQKGISYRHQNTKSTIFQGM